MSAIGNYIHYKNYNYRKYGIVFPDGQPKYNGYAEALKVFKAQKENIKKRIKTSKSSGKDLQSLEKYLNDLLHYKGANTSVSSEEAYKAFLKLVNDAFSDTFKDFFTFGEGGWVHYNKKIDNKEHISKERLKKYVDTLNNINKKISNKSSVEGATISELQNTIDSITRLVESSPNGDILIKDNKNIIDNINKALELMTLPYGGALGEAFENFLAAASVIADNSAEEEADKLIKKMVVGSAGSKVTFDLSKLDKNFTNYNRVKQSLGKHYNIDENNEYWMTFDAETSDKLDVIFKWKNQTLNVSAKNYELKPGSSLHILSGSPLLYMIQYESPSFINHWLNTITVAGTGKDEKIPEENLTAAHEAMKMTLLMKALTGQDLGRNSFADTFILNARSKGRVYVWSMKYFITQLEKNLDKIYFSNYPRELNMYWKGRDPEEGAAKARITNLLIALRQAKISVSIKDSALSL